MRRLLALLALAVSALVVAAPAAAATTEPTVVRFAGTFSGLAYATTGGGFSYEPTPYGPIAVTVDLACDGGRCVVAAVNDGEFDVLGELVLDDGSGAWTTAVNCSAGEVADARAITGTAVLSGDVLTVEEEFSELREGECPPNLGVGANRDTWVLELVDSADRCVLDDSCVDAPESAPVEDCCAPPGAPRAFAAPTVFGGLATAAEVVNPGNLVWAAVGTVILALLIAIPTHFFNSAADTLTERIGAWWRRRRGREDAAPVRGLGGWPWAAGGVLAAAVIAAFADPAFQLDAAGLRVVLSLLASFAIEVVLGWVAVILIVRRTHPNAAATIRFAPLTLLLVAAAVLLARITGFEPPLVFGLVAGVAFGGLLATAERARVALIGLGWSFGVGLVAWIAYSALPVDAVVGRELLATAAIAGLSTLPIALLPLRGLAGRTVWESSRRVWVAAYATGTFAFLLALLPLPASWADVGLGLWTWVGLYLLYALAALAIWLAVERPWRRAAQV